MQQSSTEMLRTRSSNTASSGEHMHGFKDRSRGFCLGIYDDPIISSPIPFAPPPPGYIRLDAEGSGRARRSQLKKSLRNAAAEAKSSQQRLDSHMAAAAPVAAATSALHSAAMADDAWSAWTDQGKKELVALIKAGVKRKTELVEKQKLLYDTVYKVCY